MESGNINIETAQRLCSAPRACVAASQSRPSSSFILHPSSLRFHPSSLFWVFFLSCFVASSCPAVENLAPTVLVVANRAVPESVKIAEYYVTKRGIPKANLCVLDCATTEIVTRASFIGKIQVPIREFMERNGMLRREPVISPGDPTTARSGLVTVQNKIRYIVLCYGVPLKIAPDDTLKEPDTDRLPGQFRRNEAAVDSELALLPMEFPKAGFVPNPFYNSGRSTFAEPLNQRIMLVTRLDGPTANDARALVDRALEGEKYGLVGRAYFDARGLKGGGYLVGDEWMRKAHEAARKVGFESVIDENDAIFDQGYPMTDCVVYAGWYTGSIGGALARKSFHLEPGAVAYHLHSDSGATLRSETACWVGPLVARGAACTMGCAYEPYLQGSPNVGIFFERLLQGCNFAESAYASQAMLSWQTTFVGDPLYRPCALTPEEQIAALEKDKKPEAVFAHLRRINLLCNEHKSDEALRYALQLNARLNSPVLAEKIGDMLVETDALQAIRNYKESAKETRDDWQAIRLEYKLADTYQKIGKDDLALQSYETILKRWPAYEGKTGLYLKIIPLAYKVGPLAKANAWKAEALKLDPSLTNNPALK